MFDTKGLYECSFVIASTFFLKSLSLHLPLCASWSINPSCTNLTLGHWNRIQWVQISDADSMWLLRELHSARRLRALHCWTHCHAAQHATRIRIGGCVETKWSLDLDPRSASDPDPSSHVESPYVISFNFQICIMYRKLEVMRNRSNLSIWMEKLTCQSNKCDVLLLTLV